MSLIHVQSLPFPIGVNSEDLACHNDVNSGAIEDLHDHLGLVNRCVVLLYLFEKTPLIIWLKCDKGG